MSVVQVTGLVKTYGGPPAVAGIDLVAESGELVSLLGPSGCGKTTTLRCIAGLEIPDAGTIQIGDEVVAGPGAFVPPERRDIGMVFQSYAIWPHLSVFENVAYGLRVMRLGEPVIRQRVGEVLELVGLVGYEQRMGTDLSGGQQQRVAVARSVVLRPRVLLLDEPLSNLDAKLRLHMRTELRRLQQRLGITSIYVTHDQEEAMAISDRVILMRDGRVEQVGKPYEIHEQPRTPFAAAFIGSINWLDGVIGAGPVVTVAGKDGPDLRLACRAAGGLAVGQPVLVGIRPAHIRLSPAQALAPPGAWQGRIREATYLGTAVEVTVEVQGLSLHALVPPEIWLAQAMPDTACTVHLDADRVQLFSAEPNQETGPVMGRGRECNVGLV